MLDAAERVIAREGSGASLDAIALEAGVTKPIVYARVGSRAELSNALAERLARRLVRAGQAELGDGVLDRTSLARLFATTLDTIAGHRELFVYVTRGASDDAPERTLYLAAQSAGPLAALIEAVRAEESSAAATSWAYAIVGMLNMVSMWWLEQPDPMPSGLLAEQLAELVWPGLAGSSSG